MKKSDKTLKTEGTKAAENKTDARTAAYCREFFKVLHESEQHMDRVDNPQFYVGDKKP